MSNRHALLQSIINDPHSLPSEVNAAQKELAGEVAQDVEESPEVLNPYHRFWNHFDPVPPSTTTILDKLAAADREYCLSLTAKSEASNAEIS